MSLAISLAIPVLGVAYLIGKKTGRKEGRDREYIQHEINDLYDDLYELQDRVKELESYFKPEVTIEE